MENGFRKFKNKIWTSVILRAVLAGVSVGVIAVAVQWLLSKLTAGQPDFLKFGLIGGGLALLVGGALVALWLPTDKRVAKRLDRKLELDEKVQTMIAFKNDESEMAVLQRSDTQRILMETPSKKARNKSAWLVTILPVLACICMVVTILVPAQAADDPNKIDNTSWLLNVYDEQKLKDLIEYVRTSNMQNEPKQEIVTELEDLLTELRDVKKKVEMQDTVVLTINDIHRIAKVCDTYSAITNAMQKTPSESVVRLGAVIASLDANVLTGHFEELFTTLNVENKTEVATVMASGIRQALTASKETSENALYKALEDFAADLEGMKNDISEVDLKAMLKEAEAAIALAIKQPGIDIGVEKYTINRLMAIFGIPKSQIPEGVLESFGSEITGKPTKPEEEDEEKSNFGGLGNGELVFGSDDTVYDPELEEYVPYGEVLKKYQVIITEYISDGTMSAEVEEMINDYFAILFRKTED